MLALIPPAIPKYKPAAVIGNILKETITGPKIGDKNGILTE
jgi:hypothetical protein